MKDIKERTIRGGTIKMFGQGAGFVLRLGSLMVLGRLLDTKDFGLVGMVTAVTGVFNLFRDFGLSTAAIQHKDVSEEQSSTLFWINVLVGGVLGLVCLAIAPLVVSFYHEPRLYWITVILSAGFLFNAVGIQHTVLLQRQMRFTASALIEILVLFVSTGLGVGMAYAGYGYWALVAMAIVPPIVSTVGAWFLTGWIPGKPRRLAGIRPMMKFGGTLTLNSLVVYVAYNLDKILLGRFWGPSVIGVYGRAYQLINIPTDNLNSAIGGVAFSALSRLQDDPIRLKRYFLKGYSLVLALTVPITILCAVFADDMITVVLGPNPEWKEAAPIFRLLAPTILIFALINPLTWLIFSLGMVGRSLRVALVLTPLVAAGYMVGLPYGPTGVAFCYSAVMTLWVIPHIVWFTRGTVISLRDVGLVASRPMLSGAIAGALAFGVQILCAQWSSVPRLALGCAVGFVAYAGILLYVMGQKAFFLDVLRGLKMRPEIQEKDIVVA
jgi:O-antigen/teichoic acid export membrane protein